ncbi:MAG: hypothetical protein ABIL02_06850 [candidate division WOR-3 bacterium]
MKKLVFVVAVILIAAQADTTEVIIGTPYIGNYIPFWGQSYDACRFQVLFLQTEINTPGKIIKFAFQPSDNNVGIYNNFRFYLCHTTVAQLTTVFDDNYAGNTPQLQIDSSSFTVGGSANNWLEWPVNFEYDNTSNLLVEIRWNGDNGVGVPMWRTNETISRRVYNMTSDNASTGTTQNTGNYVKLTIDRGTGIEEIVIGTEKIEKQLVVIPNLVRKGSRVLIECAIPTQLKVYDAAGKLIQTLDNSTTNRLFWNLNDYRGNQISAGVYFIKNDLSSARLVVIE